MMTLISRGQCRMLDFCITDEVQIIRDQIVKVQRLETQEEKSSAEEETVQLAGY